MFLLLGTNVKVVSAPLRSLWSHYLAGVKRRKEAGILGSKSRNGWHVDLGSRQGH